MPQVRARLLLAGAALSLFSSVVLADGVSVRNDPNDPAATPFPSNRFTVFDGTQNTLRRVSLPTPDCAVRVSDCQDIAVINTLDGFSTQPRITVPFTGDIDPATVNSDTIFLVDLGDTLTSSGAGDRVGINQVIWDPATKTLVFQSDQLLQQHSRYLLVVTDGVHDAAGKKIKSDGLGDDFGVAMGRDGAGADYRRELRDAVHSLRLGHDTKIVAASLFSTQSATTELAKINRVIKQSTPAPVNFNIGTTTAGPVRAVFPTASLTAIQFNRQVGTAPTFSTSFLPTPALNIFPGSISTVAYGTFSSPDYETADKFIPPTGTLTDVPQPQGTNNVLVQMFLPSGAKPANGWPVAIFGHGFGDSIYGAPWVVASTLASQGIASVSINVVGHGGGPLGTLNVIRTSALPVVVPAGGRGIDQDGNGTIDSTEGSSAAPPRAVISSRDGLRQTVVDLMQLVREIEVGIDVDGDGTADFDAQRIYYAGQSFGGIYGTMVLGTEPSIKAGVPNVPGGSIIEIVRLSPVFRPLGGIALAGRIPSLINISGINFNENIPLRNQPPVINTVAGAMDIQKVFDWDQWVQQPGNPVSYAAQIRKQPLPGAAAKPVIVQFAKGDQTVPNPTASAILRAGELTDRTTYFRNDLAHAANPAVSKNPHTFLTNVVGPGAPFAIEAQLQIATFFASNGTVVIDPDGAGPFFEVPIVGPLPEVLNFIP